MRAAPILLAGLALAFAAPAAAERLLVRHDRVSIHEARATPCGQPVKLTARAASAAVYAGNDPALASAVDAARAMLLFECRSLGDLEIAGHVGNGTEAVYRATAPADQGWPLVAATAPQPQAAAAAPAGTPAATDADPRPASVFEVAGLRTGMTLDQAREAARRALGTSGSYDAARRTLQAAEGGCGFGVPGEVPKAGWRCLQAVFSAGDRPVLTRLTLTQAVDQDQRAQAADGLVGRYGPPAVSRDLDRQLLVAGGSRAIPLRLLAWGRPVGGGGIERAPEWPGEARALEAEILVRDGLTIVALRLSEAGEAAPAARPQHQVKF